MMDVEQSGRPERGSAGQEEVDPSLKSPFVATRESDSYGLGNRPRKPRMARQERERGGGGGGMNWRWLCCVHRRQGTFSRYLMASCALIWAHVRIRDGGAPSMCAKKDGAQPIFIFIPFPTAQAEWEW